MLNRLRIMFKKFILFAFILLLFAGNVVAADTDGSNSTEDVVTVEGNDFNSIDNVVGNLGENSIVELNGTYNQEGWRINIDKSITLRGSQNGAILDMTGGYYSALNIYDSNVTLINLKFVNAAWSNNMITSSNSNLTVINCTFENIGYYAIDFTGNSLRIDGCSFIGSENGGVYTTSADTTIINSIFKNHVDTAIFSNDMKLNVENCMFERAADCICANGEETYLKNNVFKNRASDLGSIRIYSNKSSIKYCVFDNCGSLCVRNYSNILNCNFTGNGIAILDNVKIIVKNSLFMGGGRIYSSDSIKNVNVMNSKFDKNCFAGFCSIYNVKLINNTIGGSLVDSENWDFKKASIKNSQFSNNTFGKVMFDLKPTHEFLINNNVFSNNFCSEILDVYFDEARSSIQITNNIFSNNLNEKGDLSQIRIHSYYEEYEDSRGIPYGKYLTKTIIANNFFGFNFINELEFDEVSQIQYHNYSWINVDFKKVAGVNGNYTYSLNFVNRNGDVYNLPAYNFKIIDKKSGKILVDDIQIINGRSTFSCDKDLTLNNIFILNDAGGIVNRPKPDITIKRTGSNYDNTKITVSLSYQGLPLKNQIVRFDVNKFETAKLSILNSYYFNTNSNGVSALDSKLDSYYHHYDINAHYSSKDFAYVSANIKNVKVSPSYVILKAVKLVTTYKSGKTLDVKVVDSNNKPVKDCALAVLVKSKSGDYSYNIASESDGWAHAPASSFKVGTYNVVVAKGDDNHKLKPVKTTLTVKKAQTTVNVPKSVKKSSNIKITIKNKASKKPDYGIKVKVKVFTGKSFKLYDLKTGNDGVVSISTKKLTLGNHKVVVLSNDDRYVVSANCNVKIVK